ncbi:MAG: serine/threonine-protein kinase [Burkholderiaceae bacterium]
MTHSDIALPRGYRLQEYQIESTLGIGGFGLTYLATDANLNMQVAIKEYLPSDLALRSDDQSIRSKSEQTLERFNWGRARFLDESRTLASFRHPNIVRVMRFFEANQTAYMVMEFVAGQPLSEWIKTRRPLDAHTLVAVALALLGGVDTIHQSGYLHRDIKPSNIFIRQDDSPVLLDFGSARSVLVDTERTAIISPGYAPLEQYHSHGNQGPWSDLYAMGAVMYWIVTGQKPQEATARVPVDNMPSAAQLGNPVYYSRQLLQLIDWTLAPAEKSRPQTAAALRQQLELQFDASSDATQSAFTGMTAAPAQPATAQVRTVTTPAFDAALIKSLAADLAAHLGPVATIVVRSAAKKALDLGQLVSALANDIADPVARADFVRKHLQHDRSGTPSERSRPAHSRTNTPTDSLPTGLYPPASRPVFEAATLARAESELAQYIGAVARAVVRRATNKAHSEHELFALLAQEIDDPADRKAFLRKAMSVSGRP